MRNLKKVLSLALALVMLLGMMVVGAGAATSFKDDVDIQNKEAVAVLVGLGVMKGREDNSGITFQPDATLTRAEAAKMIAQLDLGVEAADALKANGANTFSDVWTDHWAAGAIDYCVEQGYIAGDGAGHFLPGQNVTGVQFASMLLRLLGYDAKIEGLVGSEWAAKAAALARKAGLTTNVMANGEDMTRDGMAQMAYNALTAPMVEYEGMDITIGEVAINARVKIRTHTGSSIVSNSTYDYEAIKSNITPIRLCEEKFPTLKLSRNDELDKFGRRCSVWKYKNLKIAGSEDTIEPDLHYNTKITDKTDPAEWAKMENLYAATASNNNNKPMELWINGQDVTPANQTVSGTSYAPGTRGWISYYTAPGREVEVYMNKDDLRMVERVVVVDTVLAEVTKENTDETISVKLMKTPSNKVTTGNITLNTKEGVGSVKKGDIVLVQGYFKDSSQEWRLNKDTTITSVEVAPIVTGFATLKGYDKDQDATYITVDGEKYIDAFSVVEKFTISDFSLNEEGFDCTLYMDNHGNIMKAIPGKDPNLVNDGLIAVKESYQTLKDGKLVTMVKGVISNGQTVTWQVENEASKIPANNIYTWKNENGKRTLSAIPAAGIPYNANPATEDQETNAHVATKSAGAISFKSSDVFGKDKASKVMYASDVKFIFVGESGISVLTGRQTYNLEAGKTVAQAFKDGEITAVFIGTDPDVVDVNELIYVFSRWRETDEVVDVDGKQVLYHGYKAYNADGSEIEHFLGTEYSGMANHFFKTAKTDDGKAWKPETSKTVDEHTMTSAVVAKKAGGDAWANNEDAFVLVKDGNGDGDFVDTGIDTHYDFLGSKSTKVVDLTDAKLYIESVAEINEAVKDGYYVEVAVIYNATDAPAAAPSEGSVRAAVTVFVTSISKKDADTAKIPTHTVTGDGGSTTEGAHKVESITEGAKALKFAVVDSHSGTTVPTDVTWEDTVSAVKGKVILVKAANGAKITTLDDSDIKNKDTYKDANVTTGVIGSTGVFKFTMGEENLLFTEVVTDAPVIQYMSIEPDYTAINARLMTGGPALGAFADNDTQTAERQIAELVVDYINGHKELGLTATVDEKLGALEDANGIILQKGTAKTTLAMNAIKVGSDLITVSIVNGAETKHVVSPLASAGDGAYLDDFLRLGGATIENAGNDIYVKTTASGGAINELASNATSGNIADGTVIDTNNLKGYVKLTAAAGNVTITNSATTALTSASVGTVQVKSIAVKTAADGFTGATSSAKFVKVGADIAVTIAAQSGKTTGAVANTHNVSAQVTSVTGATTFASPYKTAAPVAALAAGSAFTDSSEVELTFSVSAVSAAVSAVAITLTETAVG